MKRIILVVAVAALFLTGCSLEDNSSSKQTKQYNAVDNQAKKREAYIPHNNVEFNNYNKAQELYDSPGTIIWCTTTWGNPSAPMVTIPVAGKLTSSSTSYFSPERFIDRGNYSWQQATARSVDGMYHSNPPQYRYAFTPGGQYVDFFNMPTLCTTALTKFQRSQTKVSLSIDKGAQNATNAAEQVLKAGTDEKGVISKDAQKKAQTILEGASLGG